VERDDGVHSFYGLAGALASVFHRYPAHIFIMATGIVVRSIAPLLTDKSRDPAVVVMDEMGHYAISLVSGHIGGANRLAEAVSDWTGAEPVITTATDVRGLPAIDAMAVERELRIENPTAIRRVSMSLLLGKPVWIHDPLGAFTDPVPGMTPSGARTITEFQDFLNTDPGPGVVVDDIRFDLAPDILVLRPGSLVAGMGCNRGTGADEMDDLLRSTLEGFGLSLKSVSTIASVDLKKDEAGFIELSRRLGIPFIVFSREELRSVPGILSPSDAVLEHIGVSSVCEAAAIMGANHGHLVVPKRKTPNATLAIARRSSISSGSDRGTSTIFRGVPEPF
jgi:cobalt-precorrin 5A hydrolase